MELNNPLRPQPAKVLTSSTSASATGQTAKTSSEAVLSTAAKSQPLARELSQRVAKTVAPDEITPELRKALEVIKSAGIQIAEPKRVYLKHSYEVEEGLHARFHSMYSVLGHKTVKEAINEAIGKWCDQNEPEFLRRNGSK